MAEAELMEFEPVINIKISDRQYDLMKRYCAGCGIEHYEIWRWSGVSRSRYLMKNYFETDHFEIFVDQIDEKLLESSASMIKDFHAELIKKNSLNGIEAEFSFEFRLLEYGRQRAMTLQKLDALDILLSEVPPETPHKQAIVAAFELGMAAAEHRVMVDFEDYMHAGAAISEWRESGLPKARAERLRQGAKTRAAVNNAARQLYERRPELIRNDLETAREILKLKIPALQKGSGQQLGLDAITRCLRSARKCAHD